MAIWAANAVLVMVLIVVAAGIYRSPETAGLAEAAVDVDISPVRPDASEPISREHIDQIISSGRIVPLPPPPQPPPPPAPVEEPPEPDIATLFRHELIGTIVETDAAYAFFQDPAGKQSVHAPGEKIADATLIEVTDGRAVIEVSGRRAEITSVEPTAGPISESVASVSSTPRASAAARAPVTPAAQPATEPEDEFDDEYYAFYDEFGELDWNIMTVSQYTEYVQNIGKYVSQVVVLSHYDADRRPNGLILTRVPRESEAYKRGLREGDIIKAVQDQPVTDLQAAIQMAFQVLRDNEYLVDVVIERRGVEMVLSYEVWPE